MSKRSTEDQFAVLTEPTTLVIHRWLPGPAERIWRYLTDSELRGKWHLNLRRTSRHMSIAC